MAEAQKPSQSQDVLYQPGISFRNPKIVRPATSIKSQPWFEGEQVPGPLSASSKLRRWDLRPNLSRYSPVWNRAMKQRNMEKLGAYFHDIPTMTELGQAPPATGETGSVSRSPLGFLDNLLKLGTNVATGVTNVLQQRAEQKQQVAQAQAQTYYQSMMRPFGAGGDSTWLWIAGLGVVGLGAVYFLKRR
ncbi:hypothetical protein HOO68_05755 [Candidatus Gracilibacteria bacterium]|nr:hypothetical protein [Candidatus Gracilibacteria bacterium]